LLNYNDKTHALGYHLNLATSRFKCDGTHVVVAVTKGMWAVKLCSSKIL